MRTDEIERLEERLVYSQPENRWVKLYFDRVRFPNGAEGWYNRVLECDGRTGVVILPLHELFVGLVRQFRYPIGKFAWELPRGFGGDKGTDAQAVTELCEETGIQVRSEDLIDLGRIHQNSGLFASEVQLYAVLTESADSHDRNSDSEITEFQWFPLSRVLSMMNSGEIGDAFTMCTILRAAGRGLLKIE